jgi:hypothetical protein
VDAHRHASQKDGQHSSAVASFGSQPRNERGVSNSGS